MGQSFQYQGTLQETSIAEMFWTIYLHKVPGVIEMSDDGVEKRIYINEGNVIHATSNDRTDRLGAHLFRLGKLSREQLAETMSKRKDSGKRHGQLLIEDRLLSPRELYESIRSQMESIVWSVFSWESGDLTFKIGEYKDPMMIKIHLPMRQMIVRGIKVVPDAKGLLSRLGRKSTVFKPTYETEDLIEICLDDKEYKLLSLVNGERSLYETCTHGPFSVPENARLLYAYRVLHLIERCGDDAPKPTKIKL